MAPESEIIRFIQVWLLAVASLAYAFTIGKALPVGKTRLLFIFPVAILFLLLPLRLTSIHFTGLTGFFIGWLGTFKFALFAFNKGMNFGHFLALGSLPILISSKLVKSKSFYSPSSKSGNYMAKCLLLGFLFEIYDLLPWLHPSALLVLYSFHMYLTLEIMLAGLAAVARVVFGLQLESQFNEPCLSFSLQDFWGRRWNLVSNNILRLSVYEPMSTMLSGSVLGREKVQAAEVLATFGVSGVMHEVIMYYFSRQRPNWELTLFFLLHGACVVFETGLKRRLEVKWRVSRLVSTPLTVCFVMSTSLWLFFPQFRCFDGKLQVMEEMAAVGEFVDSVRSGVIFHSFEESETIRYFFGQLVTF